MTTAAMLRIVTFLLLFVSSLANVQENEAIFNVTCSDSAMHIRMGFTHPFKGIVFTPSNYFNPNCSYGVSTSSVQEVNLTLPYNSCGTRIQHLSNTSIVLNSIVVNQHRMLDTIYDYVQNVSCEVPYLAQTRVPVANETSRPSRFKSWILFQLGTDLFSDEIVNEAGVGHELFLTYHVRDGGVYQDMVVMNCIGHDALVVDDSTKVYQVSNPFGCVSDSDMVSSFGVINGTSGISNMMAYAIFKNVSIVTRGRFYITCGAQLCRGRCQRKCDVEQQDPLFFTDMATKDMVNRAPGSRLPSSLSIRAGKQMQAHNEADLLGLNTEERSQHYKAKMQKLTDVVARRFPDVFARNITSGFSDIQSNLSDLVTEEFSMYNVSVNPQPLIRSKRRVNVSQLFSRLKTLIIPSDNRASGGSFSFVDAFSKFNKAFGSNITNSRTLQKGFSTKYLNTKILTEDTNFKVALFDDPHVERVVKTGFLIFGFLLFCLIIRTYCWPKTQERRWFTVSDYLTHY